ncbi:MAG: DUF3299 domain-containing protein [Pseudomonadota bacterium]
MVRFIAGAFAVLLLISAGAYAKPTEVTWEDLPDSTVQDYEDPFLDLTYEQMNDLIIVVSAREAIEGGDTSARTQTYLEDSLARLAADDLDADELLELRWVVAEYRETAATQANPDMNGAEVALAGYAIPAPPAEDGTPMAYLVPERGMCSHLPPPNPNQMVRLRLPGGWTPSMMHEPVRMTGKLSVAPSERSIFVVDGPVAMRATFDMEVTEVETFRRVSNEFQTNDWATGIADRLQSSGHLEQLKN